VASWQLIERTGETLVRLLQERIDLEVLPPGTVGVQLATTASFEDLRTTDTPMVTLLLYQVAENPERRNDLPRLLSDGTRTRQPLGLELCYLITPWGVRHDLSPATDLAATREEHRLLGLILQALYDHAEVGSARLAENPARPVWRQTDGLQIVLESLPVEDHYRIWDASELGYRLSVTYRVRVAALDPAEVAPAPRVASADFEVAG
jgi:hypothetical protein